MEYNRVAPLGVIFKFLRKKIIRTQKIPLIYKLFFRIVTSSDMNKSILNVLMFRKRRGDEFCKFVILENVQNFYRIIFSIIKKVSQNILPSAWIPFFERSQPRGQE